MRTLLLTLVTTAAALAANPRPSAAQAWHPWCAHYANPGSTISCTYNSFEQCSASIRGIGGVCTGNFPPEAYGVRADRRRRNVYR